MHSLSHQHVCSLPRPTLHGSDTLAKLRAQHSLLDTALFAPTGGPYDASTDVLYPYDLVGKRRLERHTTLSLLPIVLEGEGTVDCAYTHACARVYGGAGAVASEHAPQRERSRAAHAPRSSPRVVAVVRAPRHGVVPQQLPCAHARQLG